MQIAQIQVARDEAITFEAKASAFLEEAAFHQNSIKLTAELALLRLESLKLSRMLSDMRRA
jgi:hypothetical protein